MKKKTKKNSFKLVKLKPPFTRLRNTIRKDIYIGYSLTVSDFGSRAGANPPHPALAPQHSPEGYISDILERILWLRVAPPVARAGATPRHPAVALQSATLHGSVYIGYSKTVACSTECLLL